MSATKVVTRFAPSPTGYLHIGGARTALFNWLYARHHEGDFLLRIEDTDKARSTDDAKQAIIAGLKWLGLDYDGEIVFQSDRESDHKAAAQMLLKKGAAYKCYCGDEEIKTLRQEAREAGHAFRSPWRDKDEDRDGDYAVRFRVPDGKTLIHDEVQGDVEWNNMQFDDLVLLRSDGTPTYMLAVVVDDHEMGVTHIIRGDDHLTNAGRQKQIYEALGWDVPVFAHVPLIYGPDGKKLSKRHGALGVEAYKDMGYVAEGLNNYLLRLGWSHGDKEVFTRSEAVKLFDIADINKAPARLDFDKMAYINGQHMQMMENLDLLSQATPFIEDKLGRELTGKQAAMIGKGIDLFKDRANTLPELADQVWFIIQPRPFEITGKSAKPLRGDGLGHLQALLPQLEAATDWTKDSLGNLINSYIEKADIGFGKIGQPLRVVLTGGAPAPDLTFVMELLGREETLSRLREQIEIFTHDT